MGRPREAGELFEHSERELRRVGDLYELGRLLADRAELLTDDADGRVSDAAEAANLFERMGVEHLLERARDLLAVAQIALRRSQSITVARQAAPEDKIVASSPSMLALLQEARTVAGTEGPALILGDTGSGKEVLARFVHENSARGGKEFVAVNCAAIPETLFEREFFGHARGAFTGAERDRPGLVDLADGGTMFLDEIGEMPIPMQPKLLRLLQEGSYRRVGENRERRVNVRFIAATNRYLMEQLREKSFRADLYYRLAWFELPIPPLRERSEDLVDLTKYFLARESQRSGITYWIHKEAWQVLKRFEWPGNVRQLESAIAGACARAGTNGCIRIEDLPPSVRKGIELRASPAAGTLNFAAQIESKERELILEALRRSDFHRTQAAKVLGIGRNTLYEKMKKLGIRPERAN
jgi:transcriptional regulator with PAS, ATPase and Fis domain